MTPPRRCRPTTVVLDAGDDALGRRGEAAAADHLAGDGLQVVARNWRLAAGAVRGELDLVALDHAAGAVVVVEVKTRRSTRFGTPAAAVTPAKQRAIRRLTLALLRDAAFPYRRVRFDVVALLAPPAAAGRLDHVWDAF